MAPRRQRTTLFDFIANIQACYGADTAAADALVMQMLCEQRVTFLNAAVWHEVAAVSEDLRAIRGKRRRSNRRVSCQRAFRKAPQAR
jgi:hypothetical protein